MTAPTRPSAAPPAARRTQAERTQQMRQKLVQGAIALLTQKRYAGFRIAEVADVAGVSRGAQSHHFPFKDDLVLEALEAIYRRTTDSSLARIAECKAERGELLKALVKDSTEFFLGEDFYISLDLMMVGGDSELGLKVKALARTYRLAAEQAWLDAFIRAGCDPDGAEDIVLLTFSIARGMSIRKLMSGETRRFSRLMKLWSGLAEEMLSG